MTVRIINAHVLDALATLPDNSIECCVTSPPYWGLRSYGTEPQVWGGEPECEHRWGELGPAHHPGQVDQTKWKGVDAVSKGQNAGSGQFCRRCNAWRGELGLEPDYRLYVEHLVTVFNEVRRVLRPSGTLWLNIGDCYASGGGTGDQGKRGQRFDRRHTQEFLGVNRAQRDAGLKPKDLIGIPWRVAFALQDQGWWLRQDNIWHKPNPMPESVTDRTTRSHEYLFHFSKSEIYYYDHAAIREPFADGRMGCDYPKPNAADKIKSPHGQGFTRRAKKLGNSEEVAHARTRNSHLDPSANGGRNKRSVWTIPTVPSTVQHFATFPPTLVEPCILAGCRPGGTVLDPFIGVGTTAIVADHLSRHCIGIELHPTHADTAQRRAVEPGLALQPAATDGAETSTTLFSKL